ncbi:MAG: hypothetical protein AAGG48_14435 [Planctomycetota bacterium]
MAAEEESSLEVSYPRKADSKGAARVYFDRRAFYFGRFNTPASYELFSVWQEMLNSKGEPPDMKEVRDHISKNPRMSKFRQIVSRTVLVIVALLVCVSACTITAFVTINWVPDVDGVELSKYEIERVRGMRSFEELEEAVAVEAIKQNPTAQEETIEKVLNDMPQLGESLEAHRERIGMEPVDISDIDISEILEGEQLEDFREAMEAFRERHPNKEPEKEAQPDTGNPEPSQD